MNSASLIFGVARGALVGGAALVTVLANWPWPCVLALMALGASLFLPDRLREGRVRRWTQPAICAWAFTAVLLVSLLFTVGLAALFNAYYTPPAWMVAAAVAVTAWRATSSGAIPCWRWLAMTWAGFGVLVWLVDAYGQNRSGDFHLGLVMAVGWLALGKAWLRPPRLLELSANFLIVTLVALPVLDLAFRPTHRADPNPDVAGDGYLYETARRDPGAYRVFWGRYLAQYDRLMRELFVRDPDNLLPYRVRPNGEAAFFQSRVRINSRGFRGRELAAPKGRTFRIVALGESNTFGFTLTPEHKPWPEFLEQMIQDRLHPQRPVEVINAGLPHHSLENNLIRLQRDILPLQPDLIISYHGWNGFPWLGYALPPVFVKHLPVFKRRPLQLLAEGEYRWRLLAFKRSLRAPSVLEPPSLPRLLATRYAEAYRQLIQIAQTNGVRLVLANYSMAVNERSEAPLVEFYREAFPAVYPTIKINGMHSLLVAELARQHPEVRFVDTHPQLDGQHQKFIDLVHFAPAGDLQLAETFYAALHDVLQKELAPTDPAGTAPGP